MKFDDEIVLVSKKDGTFYARRRRRDHVDPKKRSPALKYTLDRFRKANWNARGSRGFLWYGGKLIPASAALVGRALSGRRAPALHINQKEVNRAALERMLRRRGFRPEPSDEPEVIYYK